MNKFNNRPNQSYQTTCGETLYKGRSVAVCVIVYTVVNGEHLLAAIKRGSHGDEAGKWCLPCGYLDWDETLEEAAVREVFEETGLEIKEVEFMEVESVPSAHRQNVTIRFKAEVAYQELSGDNAEENEIESLCWIPLAQVGDYVWAFNHAEVIQKYEEDERSNKKD